MRRTGMCLFTTNHPSARLWNVLWVGKYLLKVLRVTLQNSQTQRAQSFLWLPCVFTSSWRGRGLFPGTAFSLEQDPHRPSQEVGSLPSGWLRICWLHLPGAFHNSNPGQENQWGHFCKGVFGRTLNFQGLLCPTQDKQRAWHMQKFRRENILTGMSMERVSTVAEGRVWEKGEGDGMEKYSGFTFGYERPYTQIREIWFFSSCRQWRAIKGHGVFVRFTVSLLKKVFVFFFSCRCFSAIRKHCHHVAVGRYMLQTAIYLIFWYCLRMKPKNTSLGLNGWSIATVTLILTYKGCFY